MQSLCPPVRTLVDVDIIQAAMRCAADNSGADASVAAYQLLAKSRIRYTKCARDGHITYSSQASNVANIKLNEMC